MRILFLSRLYYPHIGGVEKHVAQISKHLIEKGYEITVVTEQHDESLPVREDLDGVRIYRIPVGTNEKRKKFIIWNWMWQHRKLIRKAHIIHAHDVFFWILPYRFLFAHKPFYTTFHGYEGYPIKKGAKRMRKLSANLSRGNICIGKFMEKWYGTKATYISYGAIDKQTEIKINPSKHSAVFIGRLDEQTGIITYRDAFKELKKRFPDFTFSVFGDGVFRKDLGSGIKSFGFIEKAEKEFPQYRFAFVSRYLTILEAFASKRLVFSVYDNSVKEDYLRMTPFAKSMIIVRTAEELVEKAQYFLKHPDEEKKMIDAADEWVREQTWDAMIDLYEKLWGISFGNKKTM